MPVPVCLFLFPARQPGRYAAAKTATLAVFFHLTSVDDVFICRQGISCIRRRLRGIITRMLKVILYQPEIPPNTGNLIRLCANCGAALHLVEPLGFRMEDRQLRRAGLDYGEWRDVRVWANLDTLRRELPMQTLYAVSTRGSRCYSEPSFHPDDGFLFGPETRGLPASLLESWPPEALLRLPMRPDQRSMNLANAASIVTYEAWRQLGFPGGR